MYYVVIAAMKNPAYAKVRALLEKEFIKDFRQLAIEAQKKNLSKDLQMHFRTLTARTNDPGKWTVHELAQLADLLDVDVMILLKMAYDLRVQKKKGKK